ncbi:hypothetical protein BKA70DRAFT_1369366 [Coprinopsis sp. MPI-PUGE-AT-0042]|nr:hypothetical protein BKA70DRAFT_1369366 [Coprinopsis sp. MPI-PUGE-AT-0042]
MKAVLLLRPNVSLYSTDAQPANCSAWSAEAEADEPGSSSRRTSSPSPTRTCDCLTQTLCCHGCGTAVGYMIVSPCVRCTSSIATSSRSTNGHRFVFHSSEIEAMERRYVPGEKGVNEHETVLIAQPVPLPPSHPFEYNMSYAPSNGAPNRRPSSPASLSDPSPRRVLSSHRPSEQIDRGHDLPPALAQSSPHIVEYKEHPVPRRLTSGEKVYWHHLIRGGEVLGVRDDQRARRSPASSTPDFPLGIYFDR